MPGVSMADLDARPMFGLTTTSENKVRFAQIACVLTLIYSGCEQKTDPHDLALTFDGNAGLEVGGPYVGMAFHNSHMIPQRISFFYPVANSIDQSTEYWTRDTSHVMEWKLKIGAKPEIMIGQQASQFELTPFAVTFSDNRADFSLVVDYRFCIDAPAAVQTITIMNESAQAQGFQFDYRLHTSIRTSHTYKVVNQARVDISDDNRAIYTAFSDPDTRMASIFIANASENPVSAQANLMTGDPYSRYVYEKYLAPGEELEVVLILGATTQEESHDIVEYLTENYEDEIRRYQQSIESKIFHKSIIQTGNESTDHSVAWAKAVMEANKHYLDGELVPMPCPAEYNFYFAHDVLVTDLAAVFFDIARVKEDLSYIIRHANEENIIPHAYYWKDGKYVTEYASSDNWNNFWLILVTASYLRHSGDIDFGSILYPYVSKSLERALLTKEADNLMWSYRPDWWDIGHNYGPRSYMTILAIKAIREYIYISLVLNQNLEQLPELAKTAEAMQTALTGRLWDNEMKYLVNYHDDGSLDRHYYIGSLLAAHYNLLDKDKMADLVNSATAKMVDRKVGIYNAFPMDFEQWGEFMKFRGNEAGAKYYYFNGGIWPQGNAWYALALIAQDRLAEAQQFIDQVMSLQGILNGPNGQPAYYEVRNANMDDPLEYGKVDKPQFLWAGAWYLYSLYNLFGVRDNGWNIGLDPFLPAGREENKFSLFVSGESRLISVRGNGTTIKSIKTGDTYLYSAVFPPDLKGTDQVEIELGAPQYPYLAQANAIVHSCNYSKGNLIAKLSAFPGHRSEGVYISPTVPKSISLNSEPLGIDWTVEPGTNYFIIRVIVEHTGELDELMIIFPENSGQNVS